MSSHPIVMKFGGTSVGTPERILFTSQKVKQAVKKGLRPVVVVSAPGEMTDELIGLARQVSSTPDPREMDSLMATGEQMSTALFALALQAQGIPSASLTGAQAGITTNGEHMHSRIASVQPDNVWKKLKEKKVPVVAGFQGAAPSGDTATLGRGGSDLTAVALAAALKARYCEIYTDVEGIFTADPRLVPTAKKISKISYDEMLELASSGAQVMLPRAVEVAKRFSVPIHVKCSFNNEEGTWIMKHSQNHAPEQAVISGIAVDHNLFKITIASVPDKPGVAARVFSELAKNAIPLDMIVQSAARTDGSNDISITVSRSHGAKALEALKTAARITGARQITADAACAKVAVVGVGLKNDSSIAAKIFKTLADKKINIQMISTSDIKISCVVGETQAAAALRALHDAFGLSRKS